MAPHRRTPRSVTPGYGRTGGGELARGWTPQPVDFPLTDELIAEDTSRSEDSISVTVRFRPMSACSEREFQRGDEIAWYADGDKIMRNEYNLATAYAFGG